MASMKKTLKEWRKAAGGYGGRYTNAEKINTWSRKSSNVKWRCPTKQKHMWNFSSMMSLDSNCTASLITWWKKIQILSFSLVAMNSPEKLDDAWIMITDERWFPMIIMFWFCMGTARVCISACPHKSVRAGYFVCNYIAWILIVGQNHSWNSL